MNDASSRPHSSPNRGPQPLARKDRPPAAEGATGAGADCRPRRTCAIHGLFGLGPLPHQPPRPPRPCDGEPIRRYEHDHPGSLIHVDVRNIGNIPAGGGGRYLGRRQGAVSRRATCDRIGVKNIYSTKGWHRVRAHRYRRSLPGRRRRDPRRRDRCHRCRPALPSRGLFAARGVKVERVLSTTAPPTRAMCGATPAPTSASHRTRPALPTTADGKIERSHLTMADNSKAIRPRSSASMATRYNRHRPTPRSAGQRQSAA